MRKVKRMIPLVAYCCLLMSCSVGQSRQDKLLQYMENKYSEDNFAWVQNELNNNREKYGIIVSSENFPDARILVREYDNESNDYILDNYMAYYYKTEAETYVSELISEIYPENYVYLQFEHYQLLSSDLALSSSLQDFLELCDHSFHLVILLPPTQSLDQMEKDYKLLCNIVKDQEIRAAFDVCYLNDQSYYQSITLDEKSEERIDSSYISGGFFTYLNDRNDFTTEWSEGHD